MAAILCAAAAAQSQSQAPPSPTTTLQVTSKLVFLDVTVLDKKGHPVVSGLAKDDFTITEGKMPQRIFSFEAPPSWFSISSTPPSRTSPISGGRCSVTSNSNPKNSTPLPS